MHTWLTPMVERNEDVMNQSARSVFIDTSAYYAIADSDSSDHQRSVAILTYTNKLRPAFFITNFVIAEIHALALKRLGRDKAAKILTDIYESNVNVVRVSEEDEIRARQIIQQYKDKAFSFTDATSFSVMERLEIVIAFT